jgi:lysophospholipid acyltransferase (LPLAT)-like uncharacterized protein
MTDLSKASASSRAAAMDGWRASASKRLQARLIAAAGYRLISALGATLRWRTEGLEHLDAIAAEGRQPVMAFWHGRILPATYYFRRRGIVVITSENFDGEWIAGIIERFGFGTARGSTSRGARKALLQLTRDMAAGRPAGFTVDGPRGPARVAQPGAVWLAKATGNPVLPFHLEASRHWTLRSWDRTQIPKPWATVSIAMGAPFEVPPDADEAGIESARRLLEDRLHALEERALELLHGGARSAPTPGGSRSAAANH